MPREIESGSSPLARVYLFAETGEAAGWVRKIKRNPKVVVRIGNLQIDGTARVLDRQEDRELWARVAAIAELKYGWSDGLPVEISPVLSSDTHSDCSIRASDAR
ncbi:MAG: nitroreductase family deazaflavin-dependent oxidoreductase [Deltaproteobacteria bacterium]|nr:nitroreductase family deazaflavin-dependent oxidoreductase [Deltaproteobacteria bacterium]